MIYVGEIQRDEFWKHKVLIYESISRIEKKTKKPTGKLTALAEHFFQDMLWRELSLKKKFSYNILK